MPRRSEWATAGRQSSLFARVRHGGKPQGAARLQRSRLYRSGNIARLGNKVYSRVVARLTLSPRNRHVWNHRRGLERPGSGDRRATLGRMVEVLRHRGPDDAGVYESEFQARTGYDAVPGVALGHRRLAIIGVRTGHQPLANEDGTVWVVFNGEIYNFRRLRRRLEGAGHRFRTESDTEVIVHLYEDEGPGHAAAPRRHVRPGRVGRPAEQLLLARDRLGEKPLVYRHEPGRLLFASELKSILEVPGVPREIDPQSLDEYLTYQYVPHPRTIFRGIAKLPPAHYAVYRDGRLDDGLLLAAGFQPGGRSSLRGVRRRAAARRSARRSRPGCKARCRSGRSFPAGSIRR